MNRCTPNRFVPSVPFVPVGGLQAICAAFGGDRDKPPMRRKQREFGAFAGASVLPISRTSSGASRASGCPLGAIRPFCSFCRRRQKLRFSGGSPNPLYLERSEIKMSKKRRRDNTLTIRLTSAERNASSATQNAPGAASPTISFCCRWKCPSMLRKM